MGRFQFAAIATNQTAYCYDSQSYSSNAMVDGDLRRFETMGDGMIAHTPDYPIGPEVLADWMFSCAQYLREHPDTLDKYGFYLLDVSASTIEFAASVVFKEGKDRYYSVSEQKISSSDSKRNDRRYEPIERRHDGSGPSIFGILCQGYYSPFFRFMLWDAVQEFINDRDGYGAMDEAAMAVWKMDREAAIWVRRAYRNLRRQVDAIKYGQFVDAEIRNYRRCALQQAEETAV